MRNEFHSESRPFVMSDSTSISEPPPSARRLRLVEGAQLPSRQTPETERPVAFGARGCEGERHGHDQDPHVLIVGDNVERRSQMLAELRGLMPSGTPFVEACETWQVLARTSGSRMVVLTSGLGDVSTHSLMRILSRRHPTLPVIAVGGRTRAIQARDSDAARG